MLKDMLYKKKLHLSIIKALEDLEGLSEISIEEEFLEYSKVYDYFKVAYLIDAVGDVFNSIDCVISKFESLIDKNIFYYISYAGIYFLKFKILDLNSFIESWHENVGSYDITIFNSSKYIVLNDNEYNYSLHYDEIV